MPEANYCGNCGFPVLANPNEEEVRELAQQEENGFLDGFDIRTILDEMNGKQKPPSEAYQWYLEECIKKALIDIAILQQWDWFDTDHISGLFFQEDLFEEDPSDDATEDFILWARISAFFYEAMQPEGLELSIRMGALFADGLDPTDDIDVTIETNPGDDTEQSSSGPTS
ncbi:hypothetical protein SAMN05444422_1119 [Halobiforma haloterrestris]|uniref:Uncharacterized protein n=1 Tax=Natronobacterium haloterrestre TaxID=148448 RepID=A0A1I1KGX0_NATHA|nr:hypothetical protein [Halobiforma haloterrestris]SFC57948.1 hypothetical protein SAMN05444422_1119 [Halobiforma haloterrestris]